MAFSGAWREYVPTKRFCQAGAREFEMSKPIK
jgi:hypothetical protein